MKKRIVPTDPYFHAMIPKAPKRSQSKAGWFTKGKRGNNEKKKNTTQTRFALVRAKLEIQV